MFAWIKRVSEKWSGWVGDRDLEVAIRGFLNGRGYLGATTQFKEFRLVQIERPGWKQKFRFVIIATIAEPEFDDDDVTELPSSSTAKRKCRLVGHVEQDERYRQCKIEISERIELAEAQ